MFLAPRLCLSDEIRLHKKEGRDQNTNSQPSTEPPKKAIRMTTKLTPLLSFFITAMSSKSDLNPRTTHYEFFGPPGALFVTLAVPITTYALYFGCSEETGGCPPTLAAIPDRVTEAVSSLEWWKGLWDTEATCIYLAWYAFCVIAWAVLPGDQIEGVTLRTGEKKKYKINGTYE